MKTRNNFPDYLWWWTQNQMFASRSLESYMFGIFFKIFDVVVVDLNRPILWQFGRVVKAVDLKSNVFALVGSKPAIVEILLLSCGNRLLTLSFCALNIKYLNSIQMYVHKHTCQHLNRIATQRIKTYNRPLFCFISMLR